MILYFSVFSIFVRFFFSILSNFSFWWFSPIFLVLWILRFSSNFPILRFYPIFVNFAIFFLMIFYIFDLVNFTIFLQFYDFPPILRFYSIFANFVIFFPMIFFIFDFVNNTIFSNFSTLRILYFSIFNFFSKFSNF